MLPTSNNDNVFPFIFVDNHVAMGNLLRVLSKDDSPSRTDIFVDFESKFTTNHDY